MKKDIAQVIIPPDVKPSPEEHEVSAAATNGGIMTPYHRLKTDPPNR